MFTAVLVVCGAIAAWVVVDHMLARRDRRLRRGQGAWSSQFGSDGRFHSTGFEDTLPPQASEARPRRALGR
ncbi:MAG: hypothetical protein M3O01_05325 [Pseudomonadota bacterium]|nr:hypothetical protein [Pseudomonadota bacterium]